MAGLGATCAILVLLCYANTKERVNTPIDNSISFFTQIKLMFKNEQALIMCSGQLLVMIVNTLKFGAAAYFVKYVIVGGNDILATMLTSGSVAGVIAPFIANYILKNRLMKRSSFLMWSQILAGVFMVIMGVIATDSVIVNVALFCCT